MQGGGPPVGRVEVKYYGRMGNNLFQYCLGRIIASMLGFELVARAIEGFPETAISVPGRGPVAPREALGEEAIGDFQGDVSKVVIDRTPRTILLQGHFQKWAFYRGHIREIRRNWLRMDFPIEPGPEDELVVHVRSGDYWSAPADGNVCSPAPVSYYADIIEEVDPRGVKVVTESPEDPVVQRLGELYPITIQCGAPLEDFAAIVGASRIVMAGSTFSWWAALLSDASEIHLPLLGIWHPEGSATQIDLRVDQPRYVLHDLGAEDWTGSVQDRRKILDR